jgi:hypothetical protein
LTTYLVLNFANFFCFWVKSNNIYNVYIKQDTLTGNDRSLRKCGLQIRLKRLDITGGLLQKNHINEIKILLILSLYHKEYIFAILFTLKWYKGIINIYQLNG